MSNIFDVKIYDKVWGGGSVGTLEAVAQNANNITITREISKLAEAKFQLPREDSKLQFIDIGKKVQIIRREDSSLEYEGIVITPLNKNKNPVEINTLNRGMLLEGIKTPWEFQFENGTYSSIIKEELPYEYLWNRALETTDFDAGTLASIATINVASGVTPSREDVWLILATTSPSVYTPLGSFITDVVDLGNTASLSTQNKLVRVRYQAILGQAGRIRVAHSKYQIGAAAWSNWSANEEITFEDEMKHLGITGFTAASTNKKHKFKFTLSTTAIASNATWFSPAIQAIEYVNRKKLRDFNIGTVENSPRGESVTANFQSHLDLLSSLSEKNDYQWKITNSGTINSQSTIGTDHSAKVVFIEKENCNLINYNTDDEELATSVIALGHGEGLNRIYSFVNHTTEATYGRRVAIQEYSEATNNNSLAVKGAVFLGNYDTPTNNFEITVPKIPGIHVEAGDLVRFVSDDLNIDGDYQIFKEKRKDGPGGESFKLDLSKTRGRLADLEEIDLIPTTWGGIRSLVPKYSSGTFWTSWATPADTGWHEEIIKTGWTPFRGQALALQAAKSSAVDIYSSAGDQVSVEIKRFTYEGLVLRWKSNKASTKDRRYQIQWQAWE